MAEFVNLAWRKSTNLDLDQNYEPSNNH
jgi:hypothetical protein